MYRKLRTNADMVRIPKEVLDGMKGLTRSSLEVTRYPKCGAVRVSGGDKSCENKKTPIGARDGAENVTPHLICNDCARKAAEIEE